jgi:putative transposase
MPRPVRIEFPGALYHVTSRGNARKDIFHSDADRERFLDQLAHCVDACGAILYAYVLMDNHYHLLVQTPKANLSAFCQRLNTSYSLYARYRQRAPGHILQGRYKAKLIESAAYVRQVATYIHLNPARTRSARESTPAQRERLLLGYRWSSLGGYLGADGEQAFVNYDALRDFAAARGAARQAYRRFIVATLRGEGGEIDDLLRASAYAIGAPSFVEKIEQRMRDRAGGDAARRDLALPRERRPSVAVEEVKRAVAERFGLKSDDLGRHARSRGVGPAKRMALDLAARHTGLALRELGSGFGGLSPSAMTAALRRAAEERADDRELRAVFEELDSRLSDFSERGRAR